jgi:hypothetical protein
MMRGNEMRATTVTEAHASTTWLGRAVAKTSIRSGIKAVVTTLFAQEHICNVPNAHYLPVVTKPVPASGTHKCCECGQHWQFKP